MTTPIEQVISNNLCVGCGACAVASPGAVAISLGKWDAQTATVVGSDRADLERASRVCPFSPSAPNADEVANSIFSDVANHDPRVGHYGALFAGRLADSDELMTSSSGGLTSWIASELLCNDLVDGIIHVFGASGPGLFAYGISTSVESVATRRKSMYYSTSMDDVLRSVIGDGKRYALVGVPCFIRAGRALTREVPELQTQLKYFIGLVCGHLKTRGFAESLAWQVGVPPTELGEVDFRLKNPRRDAGGYDFGARRNQNEPFSRRPTRELLGGNWGHNMFQVNACNYCDDIFAETADVVLGDAWLPQYRKYWGGTNVVLCRDAQIEDIIRRGIEDGVLDMDTVGLDDLVQSQAGNYRHRRVGLAVRLADDKRAGRWLPATRVQPSYQGVARKRVKLIRLRRDMAIESQTAFAEAKRLGSLEAFTVPMSRSIDRYRKLDSSPHGFPKLANLLRNLRRRLSSHGR